MKNKYQFKLDKKQEKKTDFVGSDKKRKRD